MKFDFDFRTIDTKKDVENVTKFMSNFSLDYPNYFGWLEKVRSQLTSGDKNGIFAFSDGSIIGNLVFQRLNEKDFEIKNLRVHDILKGRGFANFMLNQLEIELVKDNISRLYVDTRVDNLPVRNLFESRGYLNIGEKKLYDSRVDVLYKKDLIEKTF